MKKKWNITKELPLSEQPYEKCMEYGAQSLSDAELLAVFLRTGSQGECSVDLAKRLLCELPGQNIAGLYRISYANLCEIRGIGKVKAIQMLCLAEIAVRILRSGKHKNAFLCNDPAVVAGYYMPSMRFLETEQVRLLILDGKNALEKEMILSTGSFTASMAAPREVFYYALKHKAVSIILLHNHPSGDPSPSKDDLVLTKRMADTGSMIGIPLLDHIVIGDNRYISLRESGYLS